MSPSFCARASVNAPSRAEQLALEQLARDRRAVDLDERLVVPRAHPMDEVREVSLPVPLSPSISTLVVSPRATCSAIAYASCMLGLAEWR
jgi:hypothetical protein